MTKDVQEGEASSSTGPYRMRITSGGQVAGYVNFALTLLKVCLTNFQENQPNPSGVFRPFSCPTYAPSQQPGIIELQAKLIIAQSRFTRYAEARICGREDQEGIYGIHQCQECRERKE